MSSYGARTLENLGVLDVRVVFRNVPAILKTGVLSWLVNKLEGDIANHNLKQQSDLAQLTRSYAALQVR